MRFCWIWSAALALVAWGCSDDSPSSPPPLLNTPPTSTSDAEISSPARAQMLQAGSFDDSPITVSGTACDSVSTVTSVTVNGQTAPLSGTPPCLDFTTQVNSRWGLNILTGEIRNQAGATAPIAQSYLRSPEYFTAARRQTSTRGGAAPELVPSGVYVQINQGLVDDSNPNDVDDLATLIERLIDDIDYNSIIPDPLIIVGDDQVRNFEHG